MSHKSYHFIVLLVLLAIFTSGLSSQAASQQPPAQTVESQLISPDLIPTSAGITGDVFAIATFLPNSTVLLDWHARAGQMGEPTEVTLSRREIGGQWQYIPCPPMLCPWPNDDYLELPGIFGRDEFRIEVMYGNQGAVVKFQPTLPVENFTITPYGNGRVFTWQVNPGLEQAATYSPQRFSFSIAMRRNNYAQWEQLTTIAFGGVGEYVFAEPESIRTEMSEFQLTLWDNATGNAYTSFHIREERFSTEPWVTVAESAAWLFTSPENTLGLVAMFTTQEHDQIASYSLNRCSLASFGEVSAQVAMPQAYICQPTDAFNLAVNPGVEWLYVFYDYMQTPPETPLFYQTWAHHNSGEVNRLVAITPANWLTTQDAPESMLQRFANDLTDQ